MTVTFINVKTAFISLYHRIKKEQYHCVYNLEDQALSRMVRTRLEDCGNTLNFPLKSFYVDDAGFCFTFYRQGQCISIDFTHVERPGQV